MGYRLGAKDTVESYHVLSIHNLNQKRLLQPGETITSSWFRNGRKIASIKSYVTDNALIFSYTVGGEAFNYPVGLTWTKCNYGGKRPWFICPNDHCKRRVATLYGGKYFLCRHCYNLSYESRNEPIAFRLLRKAQRIRERLGGSQNTFLPPPGRPKGMHRKTYQRIIQEVDRTESRMWGSLNENYLKWL